MNMPNESLLSLRILILSLSLVLAKNINEMNNLPKL